MLLTSSNLGLSQTPVILSQIDKLPMVPVSEESLRAADEWRRCRSCSACISKGATAMKYGGFLGILVLVADVYAILRIAESSASTGKKAIWIALVVLLPILGVIIWYLIGPKKA